MKNKVLESKFFNRKTIKVARDLIDCLLCRKIGSKIFKYKITETEAYVGPHDLACHSSRGKTPRNAPMFEKAGTIYVYFVYGMHFMLNIVTEKKNFPSAVLIRGVENINGPGRVTRKLKIDKKLNGQTATPKNGLWFENRKETASSAVRPRLLGGQGESGKLKIKKTTRIGVAYAGPIWAKKKYRFVLTTTKL